MRKLMRSVDRFCGRHPGFGVPNLMMIVVIGNVLVWLFSMMDTTGTLLGYLTFSPYYILRGQVWRLVTFVLIPEGSSLISIALSLYFYYFIGSTLERQWGQAKFTLYYISGMLFTIVYGFAIYFIAGINCYVTATYINLSMFFSFATLFPETRVLLFFMIPIKIKWLAYIDAAFFVVAVLLGSFPANLLPVVAVLNYLLFCGDWLLDYVRPSRVKQRSRTVKFKQEVSRMNWERENRPYSRRCEICGRTDADYPNLEFRYCSRCAGFHCYCMDHINNHTHFTE